MMYETEHNTIQCEKTVNTKADTALYASL